MAGTGMKKNPKDTDGVSKMFTGKKYPPNLRALRMLTKEVLRWLLNNGKITSHCQLMNLLEENSIQTTKLWVDVLIKSLFLCLLFINKVNGKETGNFICKLLKI